jgi:hypothetical protein
MIREREGRLTDLGTGDLAPARSRNVDWQEIQTEGNSYTFFHNQASEGAPKFFRLKCP